MDVGGDQVEGGWLKDYRSLMTTTMMMMMAWRIFLKHDICPSSWLEKEVRLFVDGTDYVHW